MACQGALLGHVLYLLSMQVDDEKKCNQSLQTRMENMQLSIGKQQQASTEAAALSQQTNAKAVGDVRALLPLLFCSVSNPPASVVHGIQSCAQQ